MPQNLFSKPGAVRSPAFFHAPAADPPRHTGRFDALLDPLQSLVIAIAPEPRLRHFCGNVISIHYTARDQPAFNRTRSSAEKLISFMD